MEEPDINNMIQDCKKLKRMTTKSILYGFVVILLSITIIAHIFIFRANTFEGKFLQLLALSVLVFNIMYHSKRILFTLKILIQVWTIQNILEKYNNR